MTAFEYNGTTITLRSATMRARLRLSDLRTLSGYWDMPSGIDRSDTDVALNMLYLVESVDGDVGFDIPYNGDATPETVKRFVDNILDSPEDLYLKWNTAVWNVRQATGNDPDLLPPSELTDDQKKAQKSAKKGDNKPSTSKSG